jgi:glyoxalase-like protein
MRLDHVIYGVRDLDEAAAILNREHGLGFLRGGRHPGGTVNSVAPLAPPRYLELLAVEELGDEVSREFARLIEGGRTLLGWGIEADDIEAVAERLGRPVEPGSIVYDDGSTGSWRFVEDPDDLSLPFFISYDADPVARRERWASRVDEAANGAFGGFSFVEVGGDRHQIEALLGDVELAVRFVDGRPGLHAVGIEGPDGEIVLRDTA